MKYIRTALGVALVCFSSFSLQSSSGSDDACAKAIKAINATSSHSIPHRLAYGCLTSVPFHQKEALDTIQQLRLFLQFYSAQTYFLSPPTAELELRPFDLNKTLSKIESKARRNDYENEHFFNADLFNIFSRFRDTHVRFMTKCYGAFTFEHDFPIIAVSDTPSSIPEIHAVEKVGKGWEVRDKITRINGEDAVEYLMAMANVHPELSWIDPDARWNQLMVHASGDGYVGGLFARRYTLDGEKLVLTWANGTSTKVEWRSRLLVPRNSFDSTDTFYSNVCIRTDKEVKKVRTSYAGTLGFKDEAESSSELETKQTPPSPYQQPLWKRSADKTLKPVMSFSDNIIELFILDNKTGVLVIRDFKSSETLLSFSDFISKAISYLKDNRIPKIIIDITGNGGGTMTLGNDAAMQFFPTTDHYFGTNMRWNPALQAMLTSNINPNLTFWDLGHYRTMDGSDFSSYQEFLGPVLSDGDYFTRIARPDLAESNGEKKGGSVLPAGYSGPQPFRTEDMIMISSGLCASTCAVFVEAMSQQGVRSVAFGGRPQSGPMQAVGGTKGSQVISFDDIAAWAYTLLDGEIEVLDYIPGVMKLATIDASVNLRNSWRKDNQDLPIEFIYDPAEYRLSYTAEMLKYPKVMWNAAKDVAWNGAEQLSDVEDPADHADFPLHKRASVKYKNKFRSKNNTLAVGSGYAEMKRGDIGPLIWYKLYGRSRNELRFLD